MTSLAGSNLRAITSRLSSTSPIYLPTILPSILGALPNCKPLLSVASISVANTNEGVTLHKFKTQLTGLLNDHKNPSARWAAAVLIKATIELGGWEILQGNGGPWVRGLLTTLGKPGDSPATKKSCIIALTKIFMLTQQYPTLIREITTPSLPAFVTTCLNLVGASKNTTSSRTVRQLETQAQLLPIVLGSFEYLLPHHPTIFRTFLSQLRPLLLTLVTPTPSNIDVQSTIVFSTIDSNVVEAAQSLFCLLPFCAPKSTSSKEWSDSLRDLITDIHTTCSLVFRSVIEDWQSVSGITLPQFSTVNDIVSQDTSSASGFPPFKGIDSGYERLVGLCGLLETFLITQTAATVDFPLGIVTDLLVRITSVIAPSGRASSAASQMRVNDEISKEERMSLLSSLPSIHVATLSIIEALCERYDTAIVTVLQTLIEQITWIFRHESYNVALKQQCYSVVTKLLQLSGGAMSKDQISSLDFTIKTCCADIIAVSEASSTTTTSTTTPLQNGTKTKETTTLNADTFLQKPQSRPTRPSSPELTTAALTLLTTSLSHILPQHLSQSLRAQMDRAAVLSSHLPAMLASVLNPSPNNVLTKSYSSILPLLARAHPGALEVEGCLRPRLPALVVGGKDEEGEVDDDEEDDDEVDVDMEVEVDVESGLDERMEKQGHEETHHDQQTSDGKSTFPTATREAQPLLGQPPLPDPVLTSESTSTSSTNQVTAPHDSSPFKKRTLPITGPTPTSPKRARLDPQTTTTTTPTPTTSSLATLPQPVVLSTSIEKGPKNVDVVTTITAASPGGFGGGDGGESDDDDFEIPELNMEPDTEDEKEEDDGAEEEEGEGKEDDEDELGQP